MSQTICSIGTCHDLVTARGWCDRHYKHWHKYGDPEPRAYRTPDGTHPIEGHRHCLRCGVVKPFAQFHKSATLADGVSFYCKECTKSFSAARRERDPVAWRIRSQQSSHRYALKKYGMTVEDYAAMFVRQKGVCGICAHGETARGSGGSVKLLAIDHCHTTGVVRGLLCSACNQGLGSFRDDVSRLTAAIEYLTGP